MPWAQDSGLADLFSGLPVRPRPQSVLFAPQVDAADEPLSFPLPPMPGYQNPGAGLTPDFTPIGQPTRSLTPGYASPRTPPLTGTDMPEPLRTPDVARVAELNASPATPSWDAVRGILGSNINGRNVSAPQVFNGGREQDPLASFDVHAPTPPSLARQLYENSQSPIPNDVRMALQNAIIARHNLNRDLENGQQNMARGLFTNEQRQSVGQFGTPSLQGGGTQARLAGAQETSANAHQTQALTGQATLEAALRSSQVRQRFMTQFPHLPPAQLEQLVAAEEARGGFAPTTLNFPVSGGGGATGGGGGTGGGAAQGGSTPTQTGSLLQRQVTPPATFAAIADRTVPRGAPKPGAAPGAVDTATTPGEFVMRLAQSNPNLFATAANREALRPYLEARFGANRVAEAIRGTRSLGPLSWSPGSEDMAQAGSLGAAGQLAARVPGGGGLAAILSRLSGTAVPPAVINTSGTRASLARMVGHPMPGYLAPAAIPAAAPGLLGRLGSGASRFLGAPLAILDGALSLPAAAQMGRSLFRGPTPEQEGNSMLEAALGRNQW